MADAVESCLSLGFLIFNKRHRNEPPLLYYFRILVQSHEPSSSSEVAMGSMPCPGITHTLGFVYTESYCMGSKMLTGPKLQSLAII